MKNKILKISTAIIGMSAITTMITLPITACSKEAKLVPVEEQLIKLWSSVNQYIIDNKVTASTNSSIETNWSIHSDKITKLISKFKLNNKSLIEYSNSDQIIIQRNLASISFKLNINTLNIAPMSLYEGYIVLDKNGTLHLNHLAISSPDEFFEFDKENREIILGLNELGQKETEILIPYGTKIIFKENGFTDNLKINRVILPDTMIKLPVNFLNNSFNLEYIKLSRNLKELPNMALSSTNLKKLDWYEGIEKIGDWAFYGSKLEGELILHKSINMIRDEAFRNMSNLTSITTWTSNIKYCAFSSSTNLKEIKLMVDEILPNTLDKDAFRLINNKTKLYVKNEKVKNDIINICIKDAIRPNQNIKESQIIVSQNL